MKTMAIYGDSFADPTSNTTSLEEKGWTNLLKKHYDVTNYAAYGSSVYYSYTNFINTQSQYDTIIFVTTNPGRWHIPYTIGNLDLHFNAPTTIDSIFKKFDSSITPTIYKKLKVLKDYYIYLQEGQEYTVDETFCKLMIRDIRQIRPDAIIIPWNDMCAYQRFFWNCFNDEINVEYLARNIFNSIFETNIICHVSSEVNQIIFENIKTALDTSKWELNLPEPFIHPHPFSYYFSSN